MTVDDARRVFGDNVKSLRKSRAKTQAELAEQLKISREHVTMIERGVRSPSFELQVEIANALHVPPDLLFRAEVFTDAT